MSMGYSDPELALLPEESILGDITLSANRHALKTAPIVTADVLAEMTGHIFPQRALYGRVIAQHTKSGSQSDEVDSPKLYINTDTPFSALVCGVQGSGKSHSTSVLLESCLINDDRIGTLPAPLSALVLHFDTAAGGGAVQPCEAAYLATLDPTQGLHAQPPQVVVLVVPTYLKAMRRAYNGLPVRVEPLLFSPEDISGERLLAMMKIDDNSQMPLYMESVMAILRNMEDNFIYTDFREQLRQADFKGNQKAMLNLRLSLLDSCLNGGDASNSIRNHFKAGQLTIVDLSSPFMDGASACGFFDIILGLFVEAKINASGKVVVLDEAHKYLSESQTGPSGRLTDSLLTVIRQQRHLATRVIISTQEPTVVPSKFLDLCSIIIAHCFSSPKWLKALAQHVSAAASYSSELLDKIVSLLPGQAIIFAPNGLCVRSRAAAASASIWKAETGAEQPQRTSTSVGKLGLGYLVVRSRLRLTQDGGQSLFAVTTPGMPTQPGRASGSSTAANQTAAGEGNKNVLSQFVAARYFPTPAPSPDAMPVPRASANKSVNPLSASSSSVPTTTPTPSTSLPGATWRPWKASTPTPSYATTSEQDPTYGWQADESPPSSPSLSQASDESSETSFIDLGQAAHRRFAPLVLYMQNILHLTRTPHMLIKTIVRHYQQAEPSVFGAEEPLIKDAIVTALRLGLLAQVDEKRVKCVEGSSYCFNNARNVSTPFRSLQIVDMTSEVHKASLPLVVYIQLNGHQNPHMKIKTIVRYFQQEDPKAYGVEEEAIKAAISSAVQVGLLTQVDDKRVKCVEDMVYSFPSR